jgi:hypothetical protein
LRSDFPAEKLGASRENSPETRKSGIMIAYERELFKAHEKVGQLVKDGPAWSMHWELVSGGFSLP